MSGRKVQDSFRYQVCGKPADISVFLYRQRIFLLREVMSAQYVVRPFVFWMGLDEFLVVGSLLHSETTNSGLNPKNP